ncbi:unnamed protein product [Lupinus luteus]|uniref:Uncharacterized protein n=1 Tax=Lupinus luteus TaxID=3873 RepID=A0AAV1XPK1_LUPLU
MEEMVKGQMLLFKIDGGALQKQSLGKYDILFCFQSGAHAFVGKRSISFSRIEVGGGEDSNNNGEGNLSNDDGSQAEGKKMRLNME